MKAKFNPKSERAIAGLNFQNTVMQELMSVAGAAEVEDTREYFKRQNPELSEKEISSIDKILKNLPEERLKARMQAEENLDIRIISNQYNEFISSL